MQSQSRLSEEERVNLVAYLDGELSDDETRELETKLSRSLSARREVDALRKSWDLLEFLPRPEAPDDFASRTITRIQSQDVAAELLVERARRYALYGVKGGGWFIAATALAVLAFCLVSEWTPNRTRDLIRDLHIFENLDAFQDVPDFKFLQEMAQLGVLAEKSESAAGSATAPSPTPASATPGASTVPGAAPPGEPTKPGAPPTAAPPTGGAPF